jgi:protein-disulfide isomerase
MISSTLRRIAFAMIAMPLALGLAACSKEKDATGDLSGEPIAKILPPAGKAWADVITKTPEGGYRMGNPKAPIKLVEYGSLTCPHCADFAEKSTAGLRDNFVASGRVSFEFRNFVRDPIDITSAMLARCGAPESFFALTDQLFANQAATFERWNAAGEAGQAAVEKQTGTRRFLAIAEVTGLTEFVSTRGIARDQANACLANAGEAEGLAKRTQDQSKEFDITGTPTFIINGAKFEGNTWDELKARLETLGAR